MSSGQKPRTREHFPRMKERGRARRRRRNTPSTGIAFVNIMPSVGRCIDEFVRIASAVAVTVEQFAIAFAAFADAIRHGSLTHQNPADGERYELDRLDIVYGHDPHAHIDAVAEHFANRAVRELDALQARIVGRRGARITTAIFDETHHLPALRSPHREETHDDHE